MSIMAVERVIRLGTVVICAARRMLRPIIRLMLHYGVPHQVFTEMTKEIYVELAMTSDAPGGKPNAASHIAAKTGLYRRDVKRIRARILEPPPDAAAMDAEIFARNNRLTRVMTGWLQDKRFIDKSGRPAELRLRGRGATFEDLVKRYSGDMQARPILDELERLGLALRLPGKRVRMKVRGNVPYKGETEKIDIIGRSGEEFLSTMVRNLEGGESFYQRRAHYDDIPNEAIPKIRKYASQKAGTFLENAAQRLARADREMNPSVQGTGRKYVVIGAYYFERDFEEQE